MRAALLAATATVALALQAQDHKGDWFAYWGYNRSCYSWSDLHLYGADYDFTLRHIRADDRPHPFSFQGYFDPKQMWVPQYNYRLGYHLQDRWSISLGLDHMKYVMRAGQLVRMDGYVRGSRSLEYTTDEGSREVALTPDFLRFEHTDGLNLLSVDLDHYDALWSSASGRFRLRAYEGIHAGPVIPRSDVRLFGEGMNNRFNLAGFGVGAQLGLHFSFLRHFFVRNTLRAGWIDLPRILTTGRNEDHASQHFWFVQHNIVIGGWFRFGRAGSGAH
ncbi:MAG: hypothetical protein QY325_06090 [Flavobacteriales bacterium]|nr:MAG: hypothetical protein QY325_06090 [Flavobacteriales bacterium]